MFETEYNTEGRILNRRILKNARNERGTVEQTFLELPPPFTGIKWPLRRMSVGDRWAVPESYGVLDWDSSEKKDGIDVAHLSLHGIMDPAHVDSVKRAALAKMGMTAETTGTVRLDMTHQRLLDFVRSVRTRMPIDGAGSVRAGIRTLSIRWTYVDE